MDVGSIMLINHFIGMYLTSNETTISVLDVGSYDIDGSCRCNFNATYFSCIQSNMLDDKSEGIVPKSAYEWKEIKDSSHDVVVSGDALKRADLFWVTISEMVRVLRPGGLICIVVPRGFVHPRPPVDSYRFDTDGIIAIARYCNLTPLHASCNLLAEGSSSDRYVDDEVDTVLIAQKPLDWNGLLDDDKYVFKVVDV